MLSSRLESLRVDTTLLYEQSPRERAIYSRSARSVCGGGLDSSMCSQK